MADNSSSNSNSWTILASEESGVENMGPLSEEQKDNHTEHEKPDLQSEPPENLPDQPSAEPPQVAPLESSDDAALSPGAHKKVDAAPGNPSTTENLTSLSSNQAQQEADGHDGKALLESDLFSDSYTHISTPPESLCTGSYAEGGKGPGDERGEPCEPLTDDFRFRPDIDKAGGLRKRKITLLSSGDRPDEDEEEEEEAFTPPQREGDFSFSLNKCIFGALILLGLGTILFSGGETDVQDHSYTENNKEHLLHETYKDPAGVKAAEMLEKAVKESGQIASLQAQLQQKEDQLKATQVKLEQGTMERLRLEQLELDNQKMRGELDKLPVLQKELVQEHERVKKELELLRNEVIQLSAVTPSAGQEEQVHSSQNKTQMELKEEPWKKEYKKDKNAEWRGKKEWNESKVQRGKAETKGKKITQEQKKWEKDASDQRHHKREGKWEKMEKKGYASRERGKHEGDKRQVKEGKEKKEWKNDKKKQGPKHADGERGKDWKSRRQEGKEEQYRTPKSKKEEKQWKKNGSGEKGGTSKKDKSWKQEAGHPNDGREKKEKHWTGNKREQKTKKGERPDMYKEEKVYKNKQHKGTEKWTQKNRDSTTGPYKDHSKKPIHADYWGEQRERIRHYHGPSLSCTEVNSCARAEELAPVHQEDFETFVSGFLNKLGSSSPETEELDKLLGEFFLDGVFVHDQVPFGEFVEDVADILEDMAEDEGMEDEMDGFKREAMETFRLREKVGGAEKTRQNARKRGSG